MSGAMTWVRGNVQAHQSSITQLTKMVNVADATTPTIAQQVKYCTQCNASISVTKAYLPYASPL